jgi:hypothetical protein
VIAKVGQPRYAIDFRHEKWGLALGKARHIIFKIRAFRDLPVHSVRLPLIAVNSVVNGDDQEHRLREGIETCSLHLADA